MKNTDILTPVRRFFNLLKVDKQEVFSIYVYALFNGIVMLSIPLGIQAIISFLTAGETSTSWVILVIFVILGVAFSGIMQIMQLTITENLQQKIFTRSAFEFAYRIPRIKFEAVDKHYFPELVQYNVKLQQLELETRLKKEMLKPMLNLKYNALAEPVGNDVFSNYNSNNYNWGVAFSMPLFLRKERGELNLAQLKLQETTLDIAIKRAGVNFKAQAAINELATTFNQTNIYLRTVKDYELLLNGEKQKFAAGESSLFMVNARETGFISTQLKLIELMAKNQKAQLAVDFAIGQLYQKF